MGRSYIGLCITNAEVTMAQISGGSVRTAIERLPENIAADGVIQSPESLAAILRSMKKKYHFSGTDCTVILPDRGTYFRNIVMPRVTPEQMKLNLPYEFRDYVGDEGNKYFYSYEIEEIVEKENGGEEMHLLAAASEKATVERIALVLRRAGLKLTAAVPREIAAISLMKKRGAAAEKSELAMIDLGTAHTYVSIFRGNQLAAYKMIDEDLSDQTESGAYEKIALEILKTLNFYRYENHESELEGILFTGPGTTIKELKEAVIHTVGLAESRDSMELLSSENGIVCAAAIGAANYSVRKEKNRMNLYAQEKNGNSLSVVLPAAIILALIVGAFTKFLVMDRLSAVREQRIEVNNLKGEKGALAEKVVGYEEVRDRYARYNQNYLNPEEAVLVNRLTMLTLLEKNTAGIAAFDTVSVTGNEMTVRLTAADLEEISKVSAALLSEEIVDNVFVQSVIKHAETSFAAGYVEAMASVVFRDAEGGGQ